MDNDYYKKYIKYKTKYLEMKNNKIGGNKNIIIHVSGASGSGKTTIGNKLKKEFGDKIIVKDMDDLRSEFMISYYGEKEWTIIDKEEYQKYINKFIKNKDKPIIFVGLNNMPWWHPDHYYDMHSKYNYYIDLDDEIILKQKCIRFLRNFENIENDKDAMNHMINDNEKFIKNIKEGIRYECNKKEIIKMNDKWKKDYEKQGYKFLSREEIFNKVSKILNEKI